MRNSTVIVMLCLVLPLGCGDDVGTSGTGTADGTASETRGDGNVADLCEAGWHVCNSPAEVNASAPNGCIGATGLNDPMLFFAQRESGPGNGACGMGANDVFGCGNHGAAVASMTCQPLDRFSNNFCAALNAPWACGADGVNEANNVTKPGPAMGGALCCRD